MILSVRRIEKLLGNSHRAQGTLGDFANLQNQRILFSGQGRGAPPELWAARDVALACKMFSPLSR